MVKTKLSIKKHGTINILLDDAVTIGSGFNNAIIMAFHSFVSNSNHVF